MKKLLRLLGPMAIVVLSTVPLISKVQSKVKYIEHVAISPVSMVEIKAMGQGAKAVGQGVKMIPKKVCDGVQNLYDEVHEALDKFEKWAKESDEHSSEKK